jgi:hypothetical protein
LWEVKPNKRRRTTPFSFEYLAAIMSNLRQKKRQTVDPDEDIEALISPDDDGSPAAATSSKPATAGRLQHNPFFVARLVLRKVGELITSDDDNEENITSSEGIIAFLRDLVIGIVFGLLSVSILIFLDHKDVIHMQSAHGYRDMGLQMMRDPETRKNVEENSGLKFMEAETYKMKFSEVNAFPAKIITLEENTRKYLADLEVAKKEHAAIKPGYDILVLDPLLGLDKFCGECSWNGGTNCDARLSYLMSTYGLQRVKATMDVIKGTPQCVRKV